MNTQEDSALARSLKDENVHPIPEGTQPGTVDAQVAPLKDENEPSRYSDEGVCTAEQAAEIDFEPWAADCGDLFSAEPWKDMLRVNGFYAISLRIASQILTKTKPELLDITRGMDTTELEQGNMLEKTFKDLETTAEFFDILRKYAHVAAMRILCCASALEAEQGKAKAEQAA